jgi:phenylpropionate dioxygenase-like ring-hydroxylating dioxygenase large terminal subunit
VRLEDWLLSETQADFVPRDVYRDRDVHDAELRLIFDRTWQFACIANEVSAPGDYLNVTIGDQPVVVVRGKDLALRAFINACTHRGALVTDHRKGNCGSTMKCMYHAWAFDLTGRLVGVPYPDAYGPEFDKTDHALAQVRCSEFGDLVFVAIDPLIDDLVTYLGEFGPRLFDYVDGIEAIGRNAWIYEGNWKLWHENFRDNYHPEFTHRWIHDVMARYADRGGNWACRPGHSVLQWVDVEPDFLRYTANLERKGGIHVPVAGLPQAEQRLPPELIWEVLASFPNVDYQPTPLLALGDVPSGLNKTGFIQTVTPLGVDRARVELIVYSQKGESADDRRWSLRHLADGQGSWGKVSGDDTEAAERVQTGLRGRSTDVNLFSRGRAPGDGGADVNPRDEYSQREFYRVYREYLRAPRGGR